MALNFPSSPTNGQTYLANGVLYVYDSTKTIWEATAGNGVTILDAQTLDGVDSLSFLRSDADDTATGVLTLSGNVNIDGDLSLSVAAIAAAGTTQGTGTALTATINHITTITAASAEAVVLPVPVLGQMMIVYNDDAADTLKIFPASGGTIDGEALNASVNLGFGGTLKFYAITTTLWLPEKTVYA